MSKNSNILDLKLFKRLLGYVLVYKSTFVFVAISAILISIFSTLTPYLIKIAVDDYLSLGRYNDFIYVICFMLFNLVLTVIFMFLFRALWALFLLVGRYSRGQGFFDV